MHVIIIHFACMDRNSCLLKTHILIITGLHLEIHSTLYDIVNQNVVQTLLLLIYATLKKNNNQLIQWLTLAPCRTWGGLVEASTTNTIFCQVSSAPSRPTPVFFPRASGYSKINFIIGFVFAMRERGERKRDRQRQTDRQTILFNLHMFFCLQLASKENILQLMLHPGIVYIGNRPFSYKSYLCSGPEDGI